MNVRTRTALANILVVFCLLLWVVGLVLGMTGFYFLLMYRKRALFFSHNYIMLLGFLLLASAVLLLVSARLGSSSAHRPVPCKQGLFVYLLVVVFCLESTACALAYFYSSKLESELTPLSELFREYTGRSEDLNSVAVDDAQKTLQCCGIYNYRDWRKTAWFNQTGGHRVPRTCCNSTMTPCKGTIDQPQLLYPQGCKLKLESTLHSLLDFVIWSSLLVFALQAVSIAMMGHLMRVQLPSEYEGKISDTDKYYCAVYPLLKCCKSTQ